MRGMNKFYGFYFFFSKPLTPHLAEEDPLR
jgi:hypothetical protein